MYDVDDERYLNPDNKSYMDLLSDNLYLEEKVQELDDIKEEHDILKEDYEELEDAYIALEKKYNALKKNETQMIQLLFDNRTLEKENKELKEKYNTLINKLKV